MGKSRRREWQARPFQKQWLKLIEAALPEAPILAAPAHELYTQPIATFREKVRGAKRPRWARFKVLITNPSPDLCQLGHKHAHLHHPTSPLTLYGS